jgi:hypothetical protein
MRAKVIDSLAGKAGDEQGIRDFNVGAHRANGESDLDRGLNVVRGHTENNKNRFL